MPRKALQTLIKFNYLVKGFSFRNRNKLRSFIHSIFKQENKTLFSLQYIFCSDKYLLKINKNFLNQDNYTDIISFDLASENGIEGEIYISIDRVKENARLLDKPFQEELQRVIFHGALHLCGINDKTAAEKKQMTGMEEKYLRQYFKKVPRETLPI